MNRRLLTGITSAGLTAALTLAILPSPASALTFNIGGTPADNNAQLLGAVAKAASSIKDTGATITAGGYKIVYDPRSLEGPLADAFTPVGSDTVTTKRGRTADGRLVVFPTTGRYTSSYGPRWGTVHRGIDIANDLGTPIYAAMDGTVINAGPAQGFGNWVVIKHDGGEVSIYGHMRYYDVQVGQRVKAGEKIASIGNEGQSTGPHLHFEIKPDGVNHADPEAWFKQQGITI